MKVYVQNASGGDYDENTPDGSPWIDYWKENQENGGDASWCRCCRKVKPDIVGGHVEYFGDVGNNGHSRVKASGKIFIVPLCKECNNPANSKLFQVEEDDLVPIP